MLYELRVANRVSEQIDKLRGAFHVDTPSIHFDRQ